VLSGLALAYEGRHEAAIRRGEEAHRLSPFDPHHFFYDACLMVPHLALGQFERVVELARRAASLNPSLSATYKGYLSALGHLGASEERETVRAKLLALEPGFTVRAALARSPLRRAADRALYAEGLRRAGLEEG
jgi:tetratricopeptide (TPR) repeat protein